MKRILLLLFFGAFLFGGCGQVKDSKQIEVLDISVSEVYSLLDDNNYHIVDVRRLYEFEEGHLPNATLIPLSEIDNIEDIIPDKSANIIVYCRTGNRSHDAALRLIELGYLNVYDMGGIESWNYEVVTE